MTKKDRRGFSASVHGVCIFQIYAVITAPRFSNNPLKIRDYVVAAEPADSMIEGYEARSLDELVATPVHHQCAISVA